MLDLKPDFRKFMDGLLDGVISDLENKNAEYKTCKKNERDNVDKFDELVDRMPKEDRHFIKKHEMNVFNIAAAEQIKDCVKLLKILGVI